MAYNKTKQGYARKRSSAVGNPHHKVDKANSLKPSGGRRKR